MKIVFAGLPAKASLEERELVEAIASYVGSRRHMILRVDDLKSAESITAGADAVLVFPEFSSDHAAEAVYQARRHGRKVVFIHIGHDDPADYMKTRIATTDMSVNVHGEEDFQEITVALRR